MATQAYSQCDDPLNFNGNRAWTNRGPKSRAGFKPGPVAPPNDVTNVATKTPSVDQQVVNLSGGNQQKVVIAKWLVKNCDILIFDEPTRGIDVGAKSEIYKLMNQLTEQGKSIIMISSEMTEILRMSDRIVIMCEGKKTGEIGIEEASQELIMNMATREIS